VTYNDSSLQDPTKPFNDNPQSENPINLRTLSLTRTFFDGSRPLKYTDLDLRDLVLPVHNSTAELRTILEPYHNKAMADFFDMYLSKVTA
jgi:hypothetical protein